mgnify:CR=1 FL=1
MWIEKTTTNMELAENGLQATTDNLQRIRELFVQGINGTNTVDKKNALQREINELIIYQENIANNTTVITDDFEQILGGTSTGGSGYEINVQFGSSVQEQLNYANNQLELSIPRQMLKHSLL